MYTCHKCGAILTSKAAFANHLKQTEKFSGEELELLKLNTFYPDTNIPQLIDLYLSGQESCYTIKQMYGIRLDALLKLKNIKRTSSEERQTAGYKFRFETGCLKKLGVTNPSKCENVKFKKAETCLKKFGKSTNLQTEEVRDKVNTNIRNNLSAVKQKRRCTLKKNHNVDNVAQIKHVRENIGKSHKARCAKMNIEQRREMTSVARRTLITTMQTSKHWKSKVEDRVFAAASSYFKSVKPHVFLWHFNFDIQIGNNLVEVNGDYWHANPECGYVRTDMLRTNLSVAEVWDKDAAKKLKAETNGYNVIVIWEKQIRKMSDDDIINYLKSKVVL